jgi:hypothetical protein
VRNKNRFWGALNYYFETILMIAANVTEDRRQSSVISQSVSHNKYIWNGEVGLSET